MPKLPGEEENVRVRGGRQRAALVNAREFAVDGDQALAEDTHLEIQLKKTSGAQRRQLQSAMQNNPPQGFCDPA